MEKLEEIQELEPGWMGWEFCKGNRRNQSLTIGLTLQFTVCTYISILSLF